VTRRLDPKALFEQSERALASANVLLDAGDPDGACNRAYYAMFNAARAALLASDASVAPHIGKTHSGLISAFNAHLIKAQLVSKEMGRLLKLAEETRLVADYNGDPVEIDDAKQAVTNAEIFVSDMRAEIARNTS
jgi:uncharacterized protein (UPF0332 family)